MIDSQLLLLQVTLPLIAAPICLLIKSGRACWAIAFIVTISSFSLAAIVFSYVLTYGVLEYNFGGWVAPWGISYRVDIVNGLIALLVSAITTIVLVFARTSVSNEIKNKNQSIFYTAWLLCLAGLLGITVTGDAFNLFVFLEISSLASYVLIAFGQDRRALTASYQYLVMGTIGATFILIGVGLLYAMTGTLNMVDIAARLPQGVTNRTAQTALAFLVVGVGLKLALFPLHLWLPNAYTFAPSAVGAFLAATATKVAIYVLLRFLFTVFGFNFSFEEMPLDLIFVTLGIVAVISASAVAIFQDNVKRMFAYSSVAQIGYMIIGLGLSSKAGLTASILHLFNHAWIKGGIFLALGCVAYKLGSVRLGALAGAGYRMPWTMAAFLLAGLSLIGVPLTAGFISKWYLFEAAIEKDWWLMLIVIVMGSLLSLIYVWRVIEMAYLRRPDHEEEKSEAPLSLLLPTWVLVFASFYFGLDTRLSVGVAHKAAETLIGYSP